MKKIVRKILLTLSTGLALTGISTSLVTAVTSCSSNSDNTGFFKDLIGYQVLWEDAHGKRHTGLIAKVENERIWLDSWPGTRNIYSEDLFSFRLPLVVDNFVYYDDAYASPDEAVKILENIKEYLAKIDYLYILEQFQKFSYLATNDKIKFFIQEAFEIFETYMMEWTIEKMDDAIDDVRKNNSLKNWKNFISYYLNTFIWKRNEIMTKLNYVQKVFSMPMPMELHQSFGEICDLFFMVVMFLGNGFKLYIQ